MKRARSVAILTTIAVGLAIAGAAPAAAAPTAAAASIGGTYPDPSLRDLAQQAGILFGAGGTKGSTWTTDGRPPNYLAEPQFAAVLSDQFNSLSPENDLKWKFVEPEDGVFDFDGLDRLVDFAEQHGMQAKGHGLISNCCDPAYLVAKTDPAEFRAAMVKHFDTIMQRYSGRMDRWDVVAEPLQSLGGGLQHNDFYKVLGPDYIAEAFKIAHAADPHAKLFLNENLVEFYPGKRQELYDLVAGLVADGVPINGVTLQMHETYVGPQPGVITEMVNSYHKLGLEVSIGELDVHTYDPAAQADIYGAVVSEALAAGIKDISTWGFTDKHLWTWLPGAKPNLFDEEYNPKPAYFAVQHALQSWVADSSAPGRGTLSSTSRSPQETRDGNYSVTMTLRHGTAGAFYRLYENDTLVAAHALEPGTQSTETVFNDKPNGIYKYRAELINSHGTTATSTTTVNVTDAAPGSP